MGPMIMKKIYHIYFEGESGSRKPGRGFNQTNNVVGAFSNRERLYNHDGKEKKRPLDHSEVTAFTFQGVTPGTRAKINALSCIWINHLKYGYRNAKTSYSAAKPHLYFCQEIVFL